MKQVYEWDNRKAKINLAKHRISFEEAQTVFDDPLLVTFPDDFHSDKEDRLISIGVSKNERLLLVIHTESIETEDLLFIRIISCRRATPAERKIYEEGE
jgi:uncharacterized DUF497 family protein